jgi:hypothetical protein
MSLPQPIWFVRTDQTPLDAIAAKPFAVSDG